jgi:2-aminoethylphosphonate transport system permease protein
LRLESRRAAQHAGFIGTEGVTTLPLLGYDKAIQEFDHTTACAAAAGLARLAPEFEEMAEAALSLRFALSMGELGATVMVYPPGWVTIPVDIVALTDRGDVFQGAALTMPLAASTLAVLVGLSQIPSKAAAPR